MENVGQVRRIQVAKHGVFSTGRVLGGLVTGGLVPDGLVLGGLVFVSFRDLVNCGCVVLLPSGARTSCSVQGCRFRCRLRFLRTPSATRRSSPLLLCTRSRGPF